MLVRQLASNELTADEINKLLNMFDNSEDFFNPAPLAAYILKNYSQCKKII